MSEFPRAADRMVEIQVAGAACGSSRSLSAAGCADPRAEESYLESY